MRIVLASKRDISDIVKMNEQFKTPFERRGMNMPEPGYYSYEWVLQEVLLGNFIMGKTRGKNKAALCFEEDRDSITIETVAVAKGNHFKGYGKKMIDYVLSKAKDSGKKEVRVESFCIYDVKDFYLGCGFGLLEDLGEVSGHKYYQFVKDLT